MEVQKFSYDNKVVKYFAYATVIWGITGMLVGLIAALQLAFPEFFNDYLGISFPPLLQAGVTPWLYSLLYNGSYIIPELVLMIVLVPYAMKRLGRSRNVQ